jgi:hypothetical protein
MNEAPDLPPIVAYEPMSFGWRGLTTEGEVLEVKGENGEPAKLPTARIEVMKDRALGYRALPEKTSPGLIDLYLTDFRIAVEALRQNELDAAFDAINRAINLAPTTRARFNHALILLAMGRWIEGFDEWDHCESREPFMRPMYRAALERGLAPWQGEDLERKRLLLVHDHGLGDTVMTLRYVSELQGMGAEVILHVPPELATLAAHFAPVISSLDEINWADYFCPMLMLLHRMRETPATVRSDPYLYVTPEHVHKWRNRVERDDRKTIGVAWSVGVKYDGDYPRSAPLAAFVQHLGAHNLVSVQQQGSAEADLLGVQNFLFEDLADCAALMSTLDEIVTIDTLALHLAGAIGHRHVTALLSHWHSWRWIAPWYRNVRFIRQQAANNWATAFAQME